MKLSELTALGPLDGRYRKQVLELAPFFSEYALIKYRVAVEVRYFQALCRLGITPLDKFPKRGHKQLEELINDFDLRQARRVKTLERATNHDVKAVEYYLKKRFEDLDLSRYKEFIHFGLTSQDINNTAIPLALKEAHAKVINPYYKNLSNQLTRLSRKWQNVPMLARTHGQPASPTKLGKEIKVFAVRLEKQLTDLGKIPFTAKFGGATGNFNAHLVAYPQQDWEKFAVKLLKSMGLSRSSPTTQIEHYDYLAAYLDNVKRLNTILLDFVRDMWQYVALGYFSQRISENEVGSSTMPHKVNPIDFENAEGNLGVANALLNHLATKLPVSRLQRDLTDSTVLRNLGVPLGHSILAVMSTIKGCGKLQINRKEIAEDLRTNWAVVAEGIQTILRREGFPKPYETLKSLTRRNEAVNEQQIKEFINELTIPESLKQELLAITPFTYTGY